MNRRGFISAGLSVLFFSGCKTLVQGEKVGVIIKVSESGFFCKTWEATMIRGGLQDGSGAFGIMPFDFTIEDQRWLAFVIDALRTQREVRVKYRKEFISWCRSDSESHFIEYAEYSSAAASDKKDGK